MTWSNYYDRALTVDDMLGNLYGQRHYLSTIMEQRPKKLLEIGSGTGAMSIFLSWLGVDVTSVDIEPAVTEQARVANSEMNGTAKFEVGDGFHLAYPDDSFDAVFHQGLFEHFSNEDIQAMVREQLRVAPKLIVSVPNHLYPKQDYGNERLMTKKQWEQIFSPFKITTSEYYSPKRLPKWYIWRAPIQYLVILER